MENFLSPEANQEILNFLNSGFFSVVKFVLGVYSVVLLADIILMLFQRGLKGDWKDTWVGMNVPSELTISKGRFRKKWQKISDKINNSNESLWKVAIIEADKEIDSLIERMGYAGENMTERLSRIKPGQIEGIANLQKAHETRNRIIHEGGYKLNQEEAKQIFGYYEDFLRYFQVID